MVGEGREFQGIDWNRNVLGNSKFQIHISYSHWLLSVDCQSSRTATEIESFFLSNKRMQTIERAGECQWELSGNQVKSRFYHAKRTMVPRISIRPILDKRKKEKKIRTQQRQSQVSWKTFYAILVAQNLDRRAESIHLQLLTAQWQDNKVFIAYSSGKWLKIFWRPPQFLSLSLSLFILPPIAIECVLVSKIEIAEPSIGWVRVRVVLMYDVMMMKQREEKKIVHKTYPSFIRVRAHH